MAAGAIEIQNLVKRYGRKLAVDEVSLSVREGETFGYLGPNGAGKTTTIRCILGLITPTAGAIRVLGHDVRRELGAVLGQVGYLPGEFNLWPQLTGEDCLEYLGSLHPRPPVRRNELCDRFELSKADLKRQVRLYSRGMKQKVGIIQAFQHSPPLAMMDEPTEGLDPLMKERFVDLLGEHRRTGGTTFLSSHILSEVEETADRVGVIRAGRLVRVGAADDLTGERIRHCTVVLKEPLADRSRLSLPGVSAFEGDGTRFRFEYRGDMQPLIEALATLPVQEFLSEPESLAEAFFEVYAGEG
ncbi:MAG TPA: ABC transporter ATP-binding protein [Actinomycetota bacterium]|nr:ABC transporter ATP-binding protein [Actinomycetota bacterium]